MKQDILDIRSRSAFGILLCGVLIGVIVSVVAFAKLKLSENELGLPLMNYQDVLVVIMTAATFFLGVIIPLAGIFAFVLVRKDVTFKVEELVNNEMLETGKLMNAVRSTAADVAIKQYVDEGVLKASLAQFIKEEVDRQIGIIKPAANIFGNEKDEYGDISKKEGT